ncbi:MAG: hypothetical protein Kow0099_01590 [Candidatus Abyssubacteria bacterium]
MKRVLLCMLVSAVMVALSADAFAQRLGRGQGGMGGWGRASQYQRMYNPDTVETISGQVLEVEYISPMRGMRQGVHLELKYDDETIPIHLGPRWFIENQEIQIEKGDEITVTGSRVTFNEKPAIIAAEVKKGEDTLVLRDEEGFPVWAGWRRTPQSEPQPEATQ